MSGFAHIETIARASNKSVTFDLTLRELAGPGLALIVSRTKHADINIA